jgi:hypothetical protein
VVKTPKIFAKLSVEDAKFTPNALAGPAHRPGEKGEKTGGGNIGHRRSFFAEKNCFSEEVRRF